MRYLPSWDHQRHSPGCKGCDLWRELIPSHTETNELNLTCGPQTPEGCRKNWAAKAKESSEEKHVREPFKCVLMGTCAFESLVRSNTGGMKLHTLSAVELEGFNRFSRLLLLRIDYDIVHEYFTLKGKSPQHSR
jgi:hypothetical protein